MLGEDAARVVLDLAECDGLESACSFKSKAEPPYSRKQIKHTELLHSSLPLGLSLCNLPVNRLCDG